MKQELMHSIVQGLTPLVAPLIVAGVKEVAPRIPRKYLPFVCVVSGALTDVCNSVLTSQAVSPATALLLGLAGIGVREALNQGSRLLHTRENTRRPQRNS